MNPASRAIASAFAGGRPSVPRPAPPGADSADDMHENTLIPYISGAIGFLAMFCSNVSRALMSTSNHVPSSRSAARMACITSCGCVMSWMQSNVVTRSSEPSVGSGSSRGSWNAALARPRSASRSRARARACWEMS